LIVCAHVTVGAFRRLVAATFDRDVLARVADGARVGRARVLVAGTIDVDRAAVCDGSIATSVRRLVAQVIGADQSIFAIVSEC
jgi:hypothetical protein